MFPHYDKNALNTLLRANGEYCFLGLMVVENMLNATIEQILQLNEEEQQTL